jgi:hypothetical protein
VGREHGDATVLFHSALAAKLGLHSTDYKALGVLDRLGPMSAGELGRHMGLAAASVTNLIDRLAARGFLRREPDPTDRRRVLLHAEVTELTENEFFASWQRVGVPVVAALLRQGTGRHPRLPDRHRHTSAHAHRGSHRKWRWRLHQPGTT